MRSNSQGFKPTRDFAMAVTHGWAEKRTANAVRIFAKACERLAARYDFEGESFAVAQFALPLATKPRLDDPMRLVDRHKNPVWIVLSEGREIHQ